MKYKIILSLAGSIILCSCNKQQKTSSEDLLIQYQYRKCINVDFKDKTIEVFFRGLSYKDTIFFTKNDSVLLDDSMDKNQINTLKGSYSYPECPWVMPSAEDKIEILKAGKIQNSIKINYHPNCSDTNKNKDLENRHRAFGNDLRSLVLKKPSFKRAMDTLKVFQEKRSGILIKNN